MKIKVDHVLKNQKGETLVDPDTNEQVILKDICSNALLTPVQEDKEKEKLQKWDLFKKIRDTDNAGVIEVTAEELTVIKRSIGQLFTPLIVGQCFDLLEGIYD